MKSRTDAPRSSRGLLSGWSMVAVLMLIYFWSFVDRSLISLLVEPIQRDLHFTDVQMGLILGPAFGIFYAFAGIPIGHLLDRYSKRWICTGLVLVWGFATAASGMTTSLTLFFLARMGLGAGEAGLSPAAYSMIAEQVPARRLSLAYSFYTIGAFSGGGLAIIGGGWLVHALARTPTLVLPVIGSVYSWQAAFLLVGGITMMIAPLALTLRENVRPASAGNEESAASPPAGLMTLIRQDPTFYLGYPFAFGSINVMVTALGVWTPAYMMRSFGWDIGAVGLAYGTVQGVAGVAGLIAMGWLVERLNRGGMVDAYVRVPAIGLCISIPVMIASLIMHNATLFLMASFVFWGLTYTYAGYAPVALQLGTPVAFRARIGAVYLAFLAGMGLFIGPTMVSWFTESVLHDKAQVGMSLVLVMAAWTPISLMALLVVARRLRARRAPESA